jgi:hypothetical protein
MKQAHQLVYIPPEINPYDFKTFCLKLIATRQNMTPPSNARPFHITEMRPAKPPKPDYSKLFAYAEALEVARHSGVGIPRFLNIIISDLLAEIEKLKSV